MLVRKPRHTMHKSNIPPEVMKQFAHLQTENPSGPNYIAPHVLREEIEDEIRRQHFCPVQDVKVETPRAS
jgi:hypothetical protein